MPAAKAKQTNGGAKPKPKASSPSSGTSTPTAAASTTVTAVQIELAIYGSGKPDKAVYDAEQNKIKAEIDGLQTRLVSTLRTSELTHWMALNNDTRPIERCQGQALRWQGWSRPGTKEADPG